MVAIPEPTFGGGEISEALLSRKADVRRPGGGVAVMKNFMPGRDAVTRNRPGTRFAWEASADALRIEEFVFNDDQSYVLEIGAGFIRIGTGGALLLTGAQSDWADATAYVPGDIAVDGAAGGNTGTFFYCTAAHTSSDGDNGPHDTNGPQLFWYALTDSGSSAILEVPTPYTAAEVLTLDFDQSGDILTVCSTGHPAHEFSRLAALKWSMLPMKIAPSVSAPTGIAIGSATGSGSGVQRKIRYGVTAVFADDTESVGGVNATTASGAQLTLTAGADISAFDGTHGLSDGDEIVVSAVTFLDASVTHENAIRALEGLSFIVDVTDANNFTLRDTADLYEDPVQGFGAPTTFISYGQAHVETTKKVPANVASGDDIEVVWNEVSGAVKYYVYRSVANGPFAFIGESTGFSFLDIGDITPDEGFTLPVYGNPFKGGSRPAASTFYQQRRVFAGSTDYPLRLWFSVLGDLRNFSTRSSVDDDESFYIDIDGSPGQGIVGIDPHGQLIARTTEQVYLVLGDQDGSLSPTTTRARPIAKSGSSSVEAQRVGDSLVFTQARGSIMRQIRYDAATGGLDGYAGRDLTLYASHLFVGRTIQWTAYAEAPNSLLWVGFTDGAVVALTHVNEAGIEAWHRHDFGGSDTVLWGAAVPEDGEDVLYLLVQRDGGKYVERLATWQANAIGYDPLCDSVFLDSSLAYDGRNTSAMTIEVTQDFPITDPPTGVGLMASAPHFTLSSVGDEYLIQVDDGSMARFQVAAYNSPTHVDAAEMSGVTSDVDDTPTTNWVRYTNEFSNLDHLEGRQVAAFGDGLDVTDGTLLTVTGGSVTLPGVYACVVIGLPIDALIETLDVDVANQLQGLGQSKKIAQRSTMYVDATRRLSVGMKGKILDEMRPTLDDGPPYDINGTDLFTGKVLVSHGARYSYGGRLQIRQAHPLPAAVGGIVPDYEFGGK